MNALTLTNDEAQILQRDLPTFNPEEKIQATSLLQEWREAEQERLRVERYSLAERMYSDLDTLGGEWNGSWQKQVKPFVTDMDGFKARQANRAFLAAVHNHEESVIAPVHDAFRDGYAREHFNKQTVTDAEFYGLIQQQFQSAAKQKDANRMLVGKAVDAALSDVLGGKGPDWGTSFTTFAHGTNPDDGLKYDWTAFRDAYGRAYQSGINNSPVFAASRDVLARITGRTETDGGLMPGQDDDSGVLSLASMLVDLPEAEQSDVFQTMALWAEANGGKKQVFHQIAESVDRTIGGILRGSNQLLFESEMMRLQKKIESGAPLYIEQGKDISDFEVFTADEVVSRKDEVEDGTSIPNDLRPVSDQERMTLKAGAARLMSMSNLANRLRDVAENEVDPIRAVVPWLNESVERGILYGAPSALLYTGAALLPGGSVLVAGSMVAGEYSKLRLRYPDANPEALRTVATISGIAMGGIEKVQAATLLNRMPTLHGVLSKIADPTSVLWKKLGLNVAGTVAEQFGQEMLQNATPAIVQEVLSALNEDVPDIDFKKEMGDVWKSAPETFFAILPLALIGAGVATHQDIKRAERLTTDPGAMQFAGILPEDAQTIAAMEDPKEREEALREAWKRRTPESIRQGAADHQEAQAELDAIQESPTTPTLEEQPSGSFAIRESDGRITAEFETEEAAVVALRDRVLNEIGFDNQSAVSELVQWFQEKDSYRTFEEMPAHLRKASAELEERVSEGENPDAVLSQLENRIKLAGLSDGIDTVAILGSNKASIREGVYTDTVKLYRGANVLTVVEERAEGEVKRALHEKRITADWLRAKIIETEEAIGETFIDRNATGEQAEESLVEGFSKLATAYVTGRANDANLPKGFRGALRGLAAYFRHVFRTAAKLLRARKGGQIDPEFEQMLAESVGLSDVPAYTQSLNEAVSELTGEPAAAGPSYSIVPAVYVDELVNRLDIGKKPPAERLQILEKAKNRIINLSRSQRFILGVEKKLGADRQQTDRIKSLQSMAVLDAVASVLPKEIRSTIGGLAYQKLASLKTSAARTKYIGEQIERVQSALEKHLSREYIERIETLFDRASSKGGTGEKARGKLGAFGHAWFEQAERISKLSELDLQKEEAFVESKLNGTSPIEPGDIKELNRVFADIQTEDQARTAYEIWENLITTFGDLKNQTADELATAHETAQLAFIDGRMKWHTQILERAEMRRGLREDHAIPDAGGPATDAAIAQRQEKARKPGDWLERQLDAGINFAQTLTRIFGKKSLITQKFETAQRIAENKERDATHERGVRFETLVKRIFPGSVLTRLKGLEALAKRRDVTIAGRKLLMSELEAVHYTMLWQDEGSKEWLEDFGYGNAAQLDLEAFLSPEAKAIRAWLENEYDQQYDAINEPYRRYYGVNLPRVRNYAPRLVDHGGNANEMALTPEQMGGALNAGFTKRRVRKPGKPPLQVDALTAYWQNSMMVDHWLAWFEPVNDMRAVLQNSDVLRSIKAKAGEDLAQNVVEWINGFHRGGVQNARGQGLLRRWSSAIADVALTANIAVALKQTPAVYASAAEIGVNQWMASAARVMTGRAAISWGDMLKSRTTQRRMDAYPITMRQAMQGPNGTFRGLQAALSAAGADTRAVTVILDSLRSINGNADAIFTGFSAAVAFDAHYRDALKLGMDETAARQFAQEQAENTVANTAQPQTFGNKSLFENRLGAAGRFLFMFQGPNRQALAMTYLAFKQGDYSRGLSNVALHWLVTGAVLQTIGNLFRYSTSDDDWEDVWEIEDYARSMMMGPLTGALYFGPIFDAIGSLLPGGYEPRLASPATEGVKGVKRLWTVFEDGEFEAKDVGAITRSVSTFLGGNWAALGVSWNVARQLLGFSDAIQEGDQETVTKAREGD